MCIDPQRLPTGDIVGCRKCWQCRETKVDDWVGRCIAESRTATRTFSISLTYGRDENDNADHIRAAVLTYSDVQKYMKRIRKSGYTCRYFAVGEYGSDKGRAHWHLIVFYYGDVPEHEISTRGPDGKIQDVRFSERHWQWGWSVWEELHDAYEAAAARAVRYVCKYLLKDAEDEAAQMLGPRMSKQPPLGDAYIRGLAADYARQGLAPQDLFYTYPGVLDKQGRTKRFRLGGVSAINYITYYLEALTGHRRPEELYGPALEKWMDRAWRHARRPNSELVDEYIDRIAAYYLEAQKWQEKLEAQEKARNRDRSRRNRFDPVYGQGFNLWRPDAQSS